MSKEKVMIFIDGSNLYYGLKKNKLKIKLEELIEKLENNRIVTQTFYYTAFLDKTFDMIKYQKHLNYLRKINKIPLVTVILCDLKKMKLKDGSYEFIIKGDEVHLAVDLVSFAYENLYDVAIIVSGDADFIPAIEIVKRLGKKVINAFFPKSSSYLLRSCCDGSINLKKVLNEK